MEFAEKEIRAGQELRARYLKSLVARGRKSLSGFLRSIRQGPKHGKNRIARGGNA